MRPRDFNDLKAYIKSDFQRSGLGGGILYALWYAFRHRYSAQAFMFWFRVAQYGHFGSLFARFMIGRISTARCIDIPLQTQIGYGLYLGHFMCMVINGDTIIGNNVNLSQFLNIGANDGKPAVIGNNVYIAPNVCIVERVMIGDNATIGTGSVVTKDVPENATVAGVPAKVLNYNRPGRYICNRFKIEE